MTDKDAQRIACIVLEPINNYDKFLAKQGIKATHSSRHNLKLACGEVIKNLNSFLECRGDELQPVENWVNGKTSPEELKKAIAEARRRVVAAKALYIAKAESQIDHTLAEVLMKIQADINAGLTEILEAKPKKREELIKALLKKQTVPGE